LANYRIYRLDGAGKITTGEWIEASNDDAAAAQGRERAGQGIVEVWDRDRLVARLRG
jgi:hypothetical protein